MEPWLKFIQVLHYDRVQYTIFIYWISTIPDKNISYWDHMVIDIDILSEVAVIDTPEALDEELTDFNHICQFDLADCWYHNDLSIGWWDITIFWVVQKLWCLPQCGDNKEYKSCDNVYL